MEGAQEQQRTRPNFLPQKRSCRALAILIVRELLMVALGRYGLTRGVELRINWPGRVSVAPLMGALFFAMCGLGLLAEVLLYVGLVLALVASALYVRSGLEQLRRPPGEPGG